MKPAESQSETASYPLLRSMTWWTDRSLVPHAEDRPPQRTTVLEEGAVVSDGPREAIYGHPYHHFSSTGRMWGTILGIADIPPETVALMFDADKTVRLIETPGHRDSLVDKIGYSRCYEKVREHRASLGEIAEEASEK